MSFVSVFLFFTLVVHEDDKNQLEALPNWMVQTFYRSTKIHYNMQYHLFKQERKKNMNEWKKRNEINKIEIPAKNVFVRWPSTTYEFQRLSFDLNKCRFDQWSVGVAVIFTLSLNFSVCHQSISVTLVIPKSFVFVCYVCVCLYVWLFVCLFVCFSEQNKVPLLLNHFLRPSGTYHFAEFPIFKTVASSRWS